VVVVVVVVVVVPRSFRHARAALEGMPRLGLPPADYRLLGLPTSEWGEATASPRASPGLPTFTGDAPGPTGPTHTDVTRPEPTIGLQSLPAPLPTTGSGFYRSDPENPPSRIAKWSPTRPAQGRA